jgi:hypothetical protein
LTFLAEELPDYRHSGQYSLSGEAAVVRGIIPWLTATAKTRTKESVTLERKATEIQLVAAQEKITNPPRNFHAVAIR